MSCTTEGATIMKSPLLCIMLMCVVWPMIATFLKCHDCTKCLGSGGLKNTEYIASIMIAAIRLLPRPRCLDLIRKYRRARGYASFLQN